MTFDPAAEPELDRWAARLTEVARALPYPPMPRLNRRLARPARAAARPTWVYAVALAAVAALALLVVPNTRAALLQFIQIGVVRLQLGPTETPTPLPATATSALTVTPGPTRTPAPPPTATATPLGSVLDLAGETTLAEVQAQLSFAVPLPSYPADLGQPDRIFLQQLDGEALVLVWLDPNDPTRPDLALFVLTAPYLSEKLLYSLLKDNPNQVTATIVNNDVAAWTTGPYVLHTQNGNLNEYRLIKGHVLIWTDGTRTYRLETHLSLNEAVHIAESLEPTEAP